MHFVKASGNSSYKFLQNIYSLKNPEKQSVSIALAFSQKYLETQKGSKDSKGVCRVHGGGFAGTIQAFVPNYLAQAYAEEMDRAFGLDSCQVLSIRPVGGTELELP